MTTVEQVRDEFIVECKNVMGFLITEHGFAEPELTTASLLARLTYCKRDIGIKCSLDIRDENVSVYLVRLENGKMPEIHDKVGLGFANNKGEVAQALLGTLLQNRYSNITVDAHGISKRQADFRRSLLMEKNLLTEHGKSVLDGSADIFKKPSPSEKGKALSAWDKKDYEQVVVLYKSLQPSLLNQNDKNRLAYAVRRIKEKAESETLWNNKDYAEVVRLYKLIKSELTEEELNRFEYAKKQ